MFKLEPIVQNVIDSIGARKIALMPVKDFKLFKNDLNHKQYAALCQKRHRIRKEMKEFPEQSKTGKKREEYKRILKELLNPPDGVLVCRKEDLDKLTEILNYFNVPKQLGL